LLNINNNTIVFDAYSIDAYVEIHVLIALIVRILLDHYLNKTKVFYSQNIKILRKSIVLWGILYLVNIAILSALINTALMNTFLVL